MPPQTTLPHQLPTLPSNPNALTTATATAPNTLTPPNTLTTTVPLLLTSSPNPHNPNGSRESKPVAATAAAIRYRGAALAPTPPPPPPTPSASFSSSACRTTAQSALGGPPVGAPIVPRSTSSPTRSSSHLARSWRCKSSKRSRSLRRLRCRSVAHLAMRTSDRGSSVWAAWL
ncbi:predicted protein [Plenodomus lingam JN3]|uniref:Predicted protein n=1 Tax=Leptosphaeria maculans (strain JN3 / isolate v23.1.3 / race Av1-4-5-6-7-8) TaxID=985895 RepID=E4ZTM9_LEPMJ|nr:predicted protein [Plenodomus lingam JN3]CBX94885.1 predicted protein [Plenodomus lingam JN3]